MSSKYKILSKAVMNVCKCQAVNLYAILYKYSVKCGLSLFSFSLREIALKPGLTRIRQTDPIPDTRKWDVVSERIIGLLQDIKSVKGPRYNNRVSCLKMVIE